MLTLISSQPAVVSLLRGLLSAEYALYHATHSASHAVTGRRRHTLESQIRDIDANLTLITWHLGYWGDCVLVGRGPAAAQSGVSAALGTGPASLRHLSQLHESLTRQLQHFAASTTHLNDPALAELLSDLLTGHARTSSQLRHDATWAT